MQGGVKVSSFKTVDPDNFVPTKVPASGLNKPTKINHVLAVYTVDDDMYYIGQGIEFGHHACHIDKFDEGTTLVAICSCGTYYRRIMNATSIDFGPEKYNE